MSRHFDMKALEAELVAQGPKTVAERLGLRVQQHRVRFARVACPLHGGSEPNLEFTQKGNRILWVCRSGCGGDGGDIVSFVMQRNGVSFVAAVRELTSLFGVNVDETSQVAGSNADTSRERASYVQATKANKDISHNDTMIERLYTRLFELAPLGIIGRTYLQDRNVLKAAESYGFGELPRDLKDRLALLQTLKQEFGLDALNRTGLLLASESELLFAWPHHNLLIPWRCPGIEGSIDCVQRRRFDSGEPRYVFGRGISPRWPFGIDIAVEELGNVDLHNPELEHLTLEVVEGPYLHNPELEPLALEIVEGAFDALAKGERFHGKRAVVAIPSASMWRKDWAKFGRGRTVIIGFDADEAGERAYKKIKPDILGAGALRVGRARPTHGKDWSKERIASNG